SASSAFNRSIVLASSDRAPRPVSASLPPLRNSSRHRYSVCSDTPARRAICTAGSSLLNKRTTIWARCSALNVDFFPISPLLLGTRQVSLTFVSRDIGAIHVQLRNWSGKRELH